ncbi:dihydrolipoyl dehydrogenase [Acinetobacter pittii]|uniref:dihydrolipoyl dehydrogenase n=1 Tax=Acinetobacter pittii TaxID=48296 RepID=UPI000A3911EB|nr:dihydrolipoyl dehydrogenase [Acinetobacter pittii]MCZ1179286.1 dihydrolipoyl dehydrogenase [Acinetobacter pittii]OTU19710.1 dihydrolipoyl dehydrogenase [Acinetobacter pittii]OTU52096.1 dihydrolipoyl dehydrogenase [Acinetobacter pittii]QDB83106.1 dihydrolipoyl dehydrogenase [Acinetobacter pittii]QRF06958.1 dihydrolipoyl dehydrogenase [Acinetobacter pittii]
MFDIIIIGAGTAGISAYKEAVKHTNNILIINDGPWDTTCARVGCMPSKVLISTANRMFDIQNAQEVALDVSAKINTDQVMQHVQTLRDRFTQTTLKDVEQWPAEHKISGKAHFIDSQTIEVNGQQYQSKSFILAVGSTPNYDQTWKKELGNRLITTDQIFELKTLPKSIAVIGSGVIALEIAQAMHRLGVETTIFARSKRIGVLTSSRLQQLAQIELGKELKILFETLPNEVKCSEENALLTYQLDETEKTLKVEYVLAATGRTSLIDTLKLENIDNSFKDIKLLSINAKTKQLDTYPIFIVGDAYTSTSLQHEAAHEGKKVVYNCLNYPQVNSVKTLTPLGIVFSHPEMATVGQSYKQLKDNGIDFITGEASYERQGRAIVLGKNRGAIEVYIEKESQKLLGAELFTEATEHMAHLLSWIIGEELTLNDILEKPFYHPTLEEGLRTALKHARRQLK